MTAIATYSTDFDTMKNGSYYTIIGAGGKLEEWINGYSDLMEKAGIKTPKQWFTFLGRDVNNKYNLIGNNRFKATLRFLTFPLDGLNIGKLAMFKLQMNDRWFDDLIDNSVSE